ACPTLGHRKATRAVIARARIEGQAGRPRYVTWAGRGRYHGPVMPVSSARPASLTRQFATLSLVTIGVSTLVVGLALARFVEQATLDREWTSTAAFVRAAAHDPLRPGDFVAGSGGPLPEGQDRLEEFTRQVRRLPEVLRLVVYGPSGEPLWS